MENDQTVTKLSVSKPMYILGIVLGVVGLFGGLFTFLLIYAFIEASTSAPSGMDLYALRALFWLPSCMIADLILKLEAGGYFVVMCILLIKRKIILSRYKLPCILTGVNLLLFAVIFYNLFIFVSLLSDL